LRIIAHRDFADGAALHVDRLAAIHRLQRLGNAVHAHVEQRAEQAAKALRPSHPASPDQTGAQSARSSVALRR
jgi:hypothetical protein